MRYPIIFPVLMIMSLAFSCKNDDTSTAETNNVAQEQSLPSDFASPPMPTATTQDPAATQPVMPQQQVASQQQVMPQQHQIMPQQPVNKNTGNQGPLNPEHGQPGHRCEIPVGAPLSAAPPVKKPAPVNTNTQPVQPVNTMPVNTVPSNTTPINITPVSEPANTETPPGMNPPHGQPGHKCEIAVGAPLPPE